MKKWIVLSAAVVITLAGVLLWGFIGTRSAAPPAAGTTAHGRVIAEARVTAYPGFDVRVGADFAGTLAHVNVIEGDRVKAGQVLATFDASVQQAALVAAQARIKQAEAEIPLASLRVKRGETLVKQRALPREALDERRRDLQVANARLHTAQAEAKELQAEIDHSAVRSPINGVVLERMVEPGQTIDRGTPLVRVADPAHLRLTADIDEFDADAIAVGDPVVITAEGFPHQSWHGKVEEIPPVITGRQLEPENPAAPSDVGVVRAKITLPGENPFRLGQRVEVDITTTRTGAGGKS